MSLIANITTIADNQEKSMSETMINETRININKRMNEILFPLLMKMLEWFDHKRPDDTPPYDLVNQSIAAIPQIDDMNPDYACLYECLCNLNTVFQISNNNEKYYVKARCFVDQALKTALCLMINESLLPKLKTLNTWLDDGDGVPPYELADQATQMIPKFSYDNNWGYNMLGSYLKKVEANLLERIYPEARKNMSRAINLINEITQKLVESNERKKKEDAEEAAAEAAIQAAEAAIQAAEKAAAEADTWTTVKKKQNKRDTVF